MKNCCTYWIKGWWNKSCCQHDKDYQKGEKSRYMADNDLFFSVIDELARRCPNVKYIGKTPIVWMANLISYPVAGAMWIMVRVFGKRNYTRRQNIIKKSIDDESTRNSFR